MRRLVGEVLPHLVRARVVEPHVVVEAARPVDDVVADVLHVVDRHAIDASDRRHAVEEREELVLAVRLREVASAGCEDFLELVEDDEAFVERVEEVHDAVSVLGDEHHGEPLRDRPFRHHAQEHRLALPLVARQHHAQVAVESGVGAEDLVDLRLALSVDLLGTDREVRRTHEAETLFAAENARDTCPRGKAVVSLHGGIVDPDLTAGLDVGAAHVVVLL
ncbi:hypothetical protein HR12_05625 [Microbacterium sp. SUBG005]|nr:hypothetical protein HR12_05625 [Microbacterium sp. SUBG005]